MHMGRCLMATVVMLVIGTCLPDVKTAEPLPTSKLTPAEVQELVAAHNRASKRGRRRVGGVVAESGRRGEVGDELVRAPGVVSIAHRTANGESTARASRSASATALACGPPWRCGTTNGPRTRPAIRFPPTSRSSKRATTRRWCGAGRLRSVPEKRSCKPAREKAGP